MEMFYLQQKNLMIAENLFPQSIWAPRSVLMAAYSYYSQDYYGDAISELKRFIKNYPKMKIFRLCLLFISNLLL